MQAQQSSLKRRKVFLKATISIATILEKKTRRDRRPLGVFKENSAANAAFLAKRESYFKKNCIIAYKY